MLILPGSRGPLTAALLDALVQPVHELPPIEVVPDGDVLLDEDLQLALYLCYELHYRGLPGVDERWEWEASLLAVRRAMEDRLEAALREAVPVPRGLPDAMDLALRAIADADDGPSLSTHLQRRGTLDQVLEFVVHRSAYQLKEADPHAWAIPRLTGRAKAALVEIEADEFGGGRADRIHAVLFADAMDELGLDATYGAYVDRIPALTLATVNLMSFLGLQRRFRGAIVGHLALFEITSAIPNRRYGDALRRLGLGTRATAFFDEHVEADAVHEAIAGVDLAGGLADAEPSLRDDILWGAAVLVEIEARWAASVLEAWDRGESSLRTPLAEPAPA